MKVNEELEQKINGIPTEFYNEVVDFIDFILEKKVKKNRGGMLNQNWFGSLNDYRKNYTSVDLQRKVFEWRK